MGWRSFFGLEETTTAPVSARVVHLALSKDQAARMPFEHIREWVCGCGAVLRIRARENRQDGPSNFRPRSNGGERAGHSVLPSASLTWNGMAEERGWGTDPAQCPACHRGMSVAEYKAHKRAGGL